MISTVTTTTVSIVALSGALTLSGVLVLLALLAQKELSRAGQGQKIKALEKVLNIGIVPLLLAFFINVAVKALEALK